MKIKNISIKFEPRDLWIGAYWNFIDGYFVGDEEKKLDIYICFIPCLPIKISLSNL